MTEYQDPGDDNQELLDIEIELDPNSEYDEDNPTIPAEDAAPADSIIPDEIIPGDGCNVSPTTPQLLQAGDTFELNGYMYKCVTARRRGTFTIKLV